MDQRLGTAEYYDAQPPPYKNADIPFYRSLLPSPEAKLLELGCGSGRVLIPLAQSARLAYGVDVSAEMLAVAWAKLRAAGLPPARALIAFGDITALPDLGHRFDLITAPFRVFQALIDDSAVTGFFATVRRHLAPGGTAVINAFHPYTDVFDRWEEWAEEAVNWERPYRDGVLKCSERVAGYNRDRFTFRPQIRYRYYVDDTLVDEALLDLHMRAYWPDDFRQIVLDHGFRIVNQWGGFEGEEYEYGAELVLQFAGRKE